MPEGTASYDVLAALSERAANARERLLDSAAEADRSEAVEQAGILNELLSSAPEHGYQNLPKSVTNFWTSRVVPRGDDFRRLCAALLLTGSIGAIADRARAIRLPPAVAAQVCAQTDRILRQVAAKGFIYLNLTNDAYLKDLGICRLQIYPCVAAVADPHGALWGRLLLSAGPQGALRLLMRAISDGGARSPYLEIHLHKPLLAGFNPDGWNKAYLLLAEILRWNPRLLGVLGGGWFCDPAMRTVSPELCYLRDTPAAGGAFFIRRPTHPEDIENATTTPSPRRQAYLEGRYKPEFHVMIWSRNDLLKWAERNGPL
jgi:hypothetical protein